MIWNQWSESSLLLNTLRRRQNGGHFTDDVFKCIFLNENVWISLKTSLKSVRKVLINNIPALVQIMTWRCSGHKPSEPMMVTLLMHICVTRPQWVYSMGSSWCVNAFVKWVIIGSGNGLSPLRCQTIFTWTQNKMLSKMEKLKCIIRGTVYNTLHSGASIY